MKYKSTIINIFKGDITEQKVDAIVNAANNTLLGGGGVDGAIHEKGGRLILEQCKKIGGCPTGEARITTAGNLPCKYVIHTVGPIYGANNDQKNLYNSYFNSLKLALDYEIKTIAFPSISTGAYNYPVDDAAVVSATAINDFLDVYVGLDEISIILYNDENYEIFKERFSKRFI